MMLGYATACVRLLLRLLLLRCAAIVVRRHCWRRVEQVISQAHPIARTHTYLAYRRTHSLTLEGRE